MKRLSAIANVTLVILLAFSFMTPATADEEANRGKCIAKGEEAVKLIKEVGNEAAIMKINYGDDIRFNWGTGYLLVMEDEKATILAHSLFSGYVDREALNFKDADGNFCFQEMIRIAKTKGKGWIACNSKSRKRDCYVLKVPDENLIVVSFNLK